MDEYPEEYIAEQINLRLEAEENGLYDNEPLTDRQEYDLWSAMSTLSSLAKETNSTVSELVKRGGYADLV